MTETNHGLLISLFYRRTWPLMSRYESFFHKIWHCLCCFKLWFGVQVFHIIWLIFIHWISIFNSLYKQIWLKAVSPVDNKREMEIFGLQTFFHYPAVLVISPQLYGEIGVFPCTHTGKAGWNKSGTWAVWGCCYRSRYWGGTTRWGALHRSFT